MANIEYFQPRVIRHITKKGVEYAMHDVYFTKVDDIETFTENACSPRAPTVAMLTAILERLSMIDAVAFICGDLGHTYDHDDIRF